jgi:hypothetical protein
MNTESEFTRIKIIEPKPGSNLFYYYAGILFLMLAKVKNMLRGYSTPRPFPTAQINRAVRYDLEVVESWLYFLGQYQNKNVNLENQNILELGPGADLGIGLTLLMKGARKYNALDVNDLARSTPAEFYNELFRVFESGLGCLSENTAILKEQLNRTITKKNDRLNYMCRDDFDISIFKGEHISLVFSQAAFEHFDDIEQTIASLSQTVNPGAVLVAEIDLQTHSRWIRENDPLNIYRYSDFVYGLFKFRGTPNRLRPQIYENLLKKYGWDNVKLYPRTVVSSDYYQRINLDSQFKEEKNSMGWLSVVICATKK